MLNLNIDDVDIEIVKTLWKLKEDEGITTYTIAKKVFPKIKDSYSLIKKESFIRSRLKRMMSYGLISEEQYMGKNVYVLDISKCHFNSLKIDEPKIMVKHASFLQIHGKWIVIQE